MSSNPISPSRPGRHRWIIVSVLCAVAFVLYVDRINISISAPHIAAEFGLSSQSLGNVLSAFLFGYALGLVPGGWLADRFGAHRVLTVAGILWAILTTLMGFIPSGLGTQTGHHTETTLFLMRFSLGLAEACAYPTFARALANWMHRSERAIASGLIHMGSNLGGIFTPVFIAFVISRFGWRHSFLFSALITLVAVLCWWLAGTDEPSQNKRVSLEELRLIVSEKEELHIEKADLLWYKRLARSREAYMLCASCFFLGISGFVFLTWFYTYLVQVRGTSDLYSAVLTSLTYLAGAIGALSGGILCDASVKKWGSPWGRRIVPLVSMTASGLLCIVAPLIRNNTGSAILFALAAGLQVVPAPAFWATIIDVTRRGPAIVGGFMNGSGNLGGALGTILFPWLVSRMDWQLALQVAGSTGIISGLLWLLIDSSRQIDSLPAVPAPSISASATLGAPS
jgi:ACS family glucarate transporter-like MFS transporter